MDRSISSMRASKATIQAAVDAYWSRLLAEPDNPPSMRVIAAEFGINHQTLSKRVSAGVSDHNTAAEPLQALTPREETALVDHMRRMTNLGHPITPKEAKTIASQLRQTRLLLDPTCRPDSIEPLGINWIQRFKSRHPEVRTTTTRRIDAARFNGANVENMTAWFNEVRELRELNNYEPQNIYNMDETGYGLGLTASRQVLAVMDKADTVSLLPKTGNKAWQKEQGSREWVTTIECVSAAGKALPPLVIFKGKAGVSSGWMPENPRVDISAWAWSASESGWTNDATALKWLDLIFLPNAAIDTPNQRRLLIVDGHGSHVRATFIGICLANDIDLMILPSHTSNISQPLDVGVFKPLKAAMASAIARYSRWHSPTISKSVWAGLLAEARQEALTERNIKSGWRNTGLEPFNPQKLLQDVCTPQRAPRPSHLLLSQPLGSLSSENRAFMSLYGSDLSTPVKNHFDKLVETSEVAHARYTLAERENTELHAALDRPKAKRKIVSVSTLGTFTLTTTEVYERVAKMDEERAAKKRAKASNAVGAGQGGPSRAPATVIRM